MLPTGGQSSSSTVDKESSRIGTGLQSSAIFNGIALVHIQQTPAEISKLFL